ncbi:Hypothetical_protein [Hexamita inflata]|uniref:Hypothetical_protein n=1 Tax=Hexamita inflata TaxID=28002 RepID=A0AA86UFS5_9EUKA|nr:Hypothetical protein HINF_LOCUS41759 [Hexamita inflata]
MNGDNNCFNAFFLSLLLQLNKSITQPVILQPYDVEVYRITYKSMRYQRVIVQLHNNVTSNQSQYHSSSSRIVTLNSLLRQPKLVRLLNQHYCSRKLSLQLSLLSQLNIQYIKTYCYINEDEIAFDSSGDTPKFSYIEGQIQGRHLISEGENIVKLTLKEGIFPTDKRNLFYNIFILPLYSSPKYQNALILVSFIPAVVEEIDSNKYSVYDKAPTTQMQSYNGIIYFHILQILKVYYC